MSERLEELTERLEQAARRLRAGDLDAAQAAELVEECARIATDATAELERAGRAAPTPPAPGQAELL